MRPVFSSKWSSFVLAGVVAGVICITETAGAQTWKKVATFDSYISIAKFLTPKVGFVGLGASPGSHLVPDVELYKTIDGGVTWGKASLPIPYTLTDDAEVSDILMVDSLNGWLTLANPPNVSTPIALWKTTDGGLTWSATQLNGSGTSVRITPHAMIVTDLLYKGHISTDGGKTFSAPLISSTNCSDFVDSLRGAISDFRGQNWLLTTDGGLSWNSSSLNVESWSVSAISGTSDFYAAPEGPTNGSPYSPQIFASTDYGATWSNIYSFPYFLTGHIAGYKDQILFCQVSYDGIKQDPLHIGGFYESTNKGLSWQSIGGPTAYHDTRFSVVPDCKEITVYGFDDLSPGTLYKYSTGFNSDAVSTFSINDSAKVQRSDCNSLDTVIRMWIEGCVPSNALIDASWISGSHSFTISDGRPLPRTLDSSDGILLQYTPTPRGTDTSYLHIRYDLGSGPIDTTVLLIGNLNPAARAVSLVLPPSPSFVEAGCTAVSIPNPLEITGCFASGGKLDSVWTTGSSAFTLSNASPRSLGLFDSIPVHYTIDGNSSDTTFLHIRYNIGSGDKDTVLEFIGHAINPLPPPALVLPSQPYDIATASCNSQPAHIAVGLTGCPILMQELDSAWITGSATIALSDTRSFPRGLQEADSIALEYTSSHSQSDTSVLHIRYNIGSGIKDTAITIIGVTVSPLIADPAVLHRESASGYYGEIDSLAMQIELGVTANDDSLWKEADEIQGVCTFDPTSVSLVNYLPPSPWTVSSFVPASSSFSFAIHKSIGAGGVPFDLGTALFRPKNSGISASWVTLSQLSIKLDSQEFSLCVTDNEDKHWAIKTLGVPLDSVQNVDTQQISVCFEEGRLTINNLSSSRATIGVYDILGREIASVDSEPGNAGTVDLTKEPVGTYFVEIDTESGRAVRVIQKSQY